MKNTILLVFCALLITSCGAVGRGLGTATRVMTSPVRVVVGHNDTMDGNTHIPDEAYIDYAE